MSRIPIVVRFYVLGLVAFVLVSYATVDITARAHDAWWAASGSPALSDVHPYGVLAARAQGAPLTADDLSEFLATWFPRYEFAVVDAGGAVRQRRGFAEVSEFRPSALDWSEGDRVYDPAAQADAYRVSAASGPPLYTFIRVVPSEEQERIASAYWWAALAAVLGGHLALAAWFVWTIGGPLHRVTAAAQALADGRLDARTRMRGADEIGRLGSAFDTMAERLEAALRAQQVLMGQVSHELRTPLARLRVAVDLAREGDVARVRRTLDGMDVDLHELESLVAEILAYARLEVASARGVPALHVAPVQTDAFVRSVVERFRAANPERDVTLAVGPRVPEVRGDEVLLARALTNLLQNAHAFAPEGRPVAVEVSGVPGHVEIRVLDDGPGVPPDEIERLFEPFFQGRRRAATTGGFGLGLSLCRRAALAHGGTIDLDNRPEGGAVVTLRLPTTHSDQ